MQINPTDDIKISAILPNYNSLEFLSKATLSLLNQTEPFTEIVIVDDGSTDESLVLINSFMEKHNHIRLIKHEKNQGVTPALNHGVEQAIGDYIILCAADDWYHEEMVALAKQAIRQHPSVGIICGDAIVYRYDKRAPFRRTLPYSINTLITSNQFKSLSRQRYVGFNGGGAMFMHRQAVLNAGMLYPELRWHSDWLLYFAVALQQGIYYVNHIFAYVNIRREGYSEGKRNTKIQNQVMLATIQIIQQQYRYLWKDFKEAALLPNYGLRYIPLFLTNSTARQFLTPTLLWKFFINNAVIVRIARLFPYKIILGMRKLLRA